MEDISSRILAFNADRAPALAALKYQAMAENHFRFYRGTDHIFYEDLKKSHGIPASPTAWICGDLHLENFGTYKSDNRLVYFDLNDFDEAILAPAAWELVRMVTSIFIAFESLQIDPKKALNMAQLYIKKYADTLVTGKPDFVEQQTAKGIVAEFLAAVCKRKQKDILAKKTIFKKDRVEILLDDPRHDKLDKQLKKELFRHVDNWLKNDGNSPYNYKVIDAVFRLAGTGSLGVNRYALLLKSLNKTGEKYLLIDMKEAKDSSLAPFVHLPQPAWTNAAARVVTIQQRMQNRSPALLSTTVFRDASYVIQEMQPTKDSINFKMIKKEYRNIYQVINDMAMLTASAHLRSTGRQGSDNADALVAFGADTSWQNGVLQYALDYADRVRDYYGQFYIDFESGLFKPKRIRQQPAEQIPA